MFHCLQFTMSSGGKMTSCVGSKGAKSAALNKDVDSCSKTQVTVRNMKHAGLRSVYNGSDSHQRRPLSCSQLRSHWSDSSRSPAPGRHSTPPPGRTKYTHRYIHITLKRSNQCFRLVFFVLNLFGRCSISHQSPI